MNLGSFGAAAGSAVQGFRQAQAQDQQLAMNAQSMQMQQRRMAMAEQDQAAQQEQRQRQAALRDESAKLFNQFYGEREETVGETVSDDGQGGKARIPTVRKTAVQPGTDPDTDRKFYVAMLQTQAKHAGVDAQQVAAMQTRLDELRRTETGRLLDKVAMGDSASTEKLLKSLGKDPEGAKHDFRPLDGVNNIVLANGEKLDLKKYALANATVQYHKNMLAEEEAAQGIETHKAKVGNLGAQTKLAEARAAAEPIEAAAKANESAARVRLANARAANVGAGAGAAAAKGADKAVRDAVKMVAPKDALGKPDSQATSVLLALTSQALAGGKLKEPNAAAAAARQQYDAIASDAASRVAVLRKAKKNPADYGGATWDQVIAVQVAKKLKLDAPAAGSTNESDDE